MQFFLYVQYTEHVIKLLSYCYKCCPDEPQDTFKYNPVTNGPHLFGASNISRTETITKDETTEDIFTSLMQHVDKF